MIMLTKNEILSYLPSNKGYFKSKFNIVKIGIFGSFARGEETEKSDIDVLILMGDDTEDIFEKRLELRELISTHFSRAVDVCHENAIKPIFKPLILKDVIYA